MMRDTVERKDGEPGKVWRFAPVPASTWRQMTAPDASMGRVFGALVKSSPSIVGTVVEDELV